MTDVFDLSDRELEILELLAVGASNKEIATRLVISTNTVKVHLRNIYAKLGVSSRTEAVMTSLRENLIDVEGIATSDANGVTTGDMDRSVISLRFGRWEIKSKKIWILTISLVVMFLAAIIGMLFLIRGGSQVVAENSDVDRWERKADLPTPRSGLALVAYANQIYAIGGESPTGITGVMERYDPILDQWSTLETKPLPVTDVKAAVIGERIYVPGGRLQTGELTDVVEVYDPLLSKWDRINPLPIKIAGYAMVAFEGKLYLFGGWDGETYRDDTFIFDPDLDQWEISTPMSGSRAYADAVVAGDAIYVMGGENDQGVLVSNEIYYPERDRLGNSAVWETSVPIPPAEHRTGIVSLAEIIHIFEMDQNENSVRVMTFVPQLNEWHMASELPIPLFTSPGVTGLGTEIYIIGGESKGQPSPSVYAYQAIFTVLIPVVR
jgi:DNA-binding CsgD family transcriptional regulator